MVMSEIKTDLSLTQHAFLVAWGGFARAIGLTQMIDAQSLQQKTYFHTPQTKVLEFLVGTLAGLEHLQDLSRSAHPLDQDQAVAAAWGRPGWADYSGVSRTLQSLSMAEAQQLAQGLQTISQPLLDAEINLALLSGRLVWDGDLTGLPVSDTSTSYAGAAFGYMDADIRLGYQAALISLTSPTYGRLWLSGTHHPGDTVSCTQAEGLVRAAEARVGLRPWRRTDLLRQRLTSLNQHGVGLAQRVERQQAAVAQAQAKVLTAIRQSEQSRQALVSVAQLYQAGQRPERPHSQLAQARHQRQVAHTRQLNAQQRLTEAQRRLTKSQRLLTEVQAQQQLLQTRLAQFEADNAAHPQPVTIVIRLDAGFGSYANLTLLIEMGYEVYTKPFSHQVVQALKRQAKNASWTRVGANAEMMAWSNHALKGCPYRLDVALERFYTGDTRRYSALLHFGTDRVTQNLPAWFATYNRRQTVEAGIKEGKHVFCLHHFKVRAEPAIFLQEQIVLFAANFIRWANHSLVVSTAQPAATTLHPAQWGLKKLVHVAAHTSAEVSQDKDGLLLKFTPQSVFAGKSLKITGYSFQPPLPFFKTCNLRPFSMSPPLIAQNLG
jgi:hypothetical protein